MEILSSTSASGMEISATIASKSSRVPHWLVVLCETGTSPQCDAQRVDAVSVHGSHDVFIRYEAPDGVLIDNKGVARVRVIKGDVHDQKDVMVQLRQTDELLTLDITASKKTVEIVLVQKNQLQRVVNQGSGDVVVEDNVLLAMGPGLSIAALGSGNVFAMATETLKVDTLTLTSKGSGLVQTSFSEIQVSTLVVEYYSSGNIAVFTRSESGVDHLAVVAKGSGNACLNWGEPLFVNDFEIQQVGSGDVTVGPQGFCQEAKLSMQGSGRLDVGGVQCDYVDVNLMSSGKVIVQAATALAVEAYGSGDVQFTGDSPRAIANTGVKQLIPTHVKSSYLPASCKRRKIPVIKPKYAALSSGVFASTGIGVELDSAESSSSVTGVFLDGMKNDTDNILPLAGVVFLVAMVLRWFNNSQRRAREEQRQPLLGAQRRVYV